jgi:type I restriction enzyme S subunit
MTFRELQLQDILDVQWGDTKTTKSSYVPTGYLAYSASGPDGFLDRFDYDREGIVLSAIGANCGTTFFATGKWSCIKNTIRIFPKSESIDLKYMYYITKSPDFWPIRGSAQSFISQTDIRELYVQLPELGVQRFIGNLLYELEQKINVNKAVSSTLQEITQALFKSWFIDFDPVRAKMAGEKPLGMDNETASLFPDSMDETELGLIPTSWDVLPASELFEIGIGRTPPRKEPEWFSKDNIGVPWVSIRDMGTFGVFSQFTSECLTEEAVSKFRVPIVPAHTVLMSFKLTVGKLCITDRPLVTNEAIAHFRVPTEGRLDSNYAYLWLSSYDMRTLDSTSSIGTATNSGVIRNIKFLVPSEGVLVKFQKTIEPIFKNLQLLQEQSAILAEIRDSLLPRLVSGELQIPEEMLAS